jgi:hypothetical protein
LVQDARDRRGGNARASCNVDEVHVLVSRRREDSHKRVDTPAASRMF